MTMARKSAAYILPLADDRFDMLREEASSWDRFAEPVDDFDHPRGLPLVCLVSDSGGETHYVAKAARGNRAGTGLRRLNLTGIVELRPPVRLDELVSEVPPAIRSALASRLRYGGKLTVNQFRALVDAAVARGGQLADLLARYSTERIERINALSPATRRELAFQKEAIATALAISGLDRGELQEWEPPAGGRPASFLDGLARARVREDLMIVNDFAKFPGFALDRTAVTGAAVFYDGQGTPLTVIIANRQPLEELTGADLIYCNERFNSFVMVQYKAMEREGNREAVFRLPNDQLAKEVARMESVLAEISPMSEVRDCSGFRLCPNPFFLKLCSRVVFNPDDMSLVSGMYIPLEQWKLLEKSESTRGPNGGQVITFENVDRHLTNTEFQLLVSKAWVGTTPAQSVVLGRAIRETIESGRAAVIALAR
jgi:hypothetical protein